MKGVTYSVVLHHCARVWFAIVPPLKNEVIFPALFPVREGISSKARSLSRQGLMSPGEEGPQEVTTGDQRFIKTLGRVYQALFPILYGFETRGDGRTRSWTGRVCFRRSTSKVRPLSLLGRGEPKAVSGSRWSTSRAPSTVLYCSRHTVHVGVAGRCTTAAHESETGGSSKRNRPATVRYLMV